MESEHLSNDLSFVILGSDSLTAETNSDHHSSYNISQNYSLDSHTSLDVQEKLDQLLKENKDLKNALNQNNLAMKTQFETLAEWQQEVLLTHQNHKQKFSETRDLVLKLKTENQLLKNDLTDVKQKSAEGSDCNSYNSLGSSYSKDCEKLKAENLILVKERNAFREECTRLTIKISDLESIIRKKSEEISLLRGNYGSLSMINESKTQHDDFSSEIQKKQSEVANTSNYNNDNCSLQSWSCVQGKLDYRHKVLQEENDSLKSLLREEKLSNVSVLSDLIKREEKLKKELALKKDIDDLLQKKIEEISGLKNELSLKEKLLSSAISELQEERKKNIQLSIDADKHSLLQTQVEAYEADFKEERSAREKLAGEKESLAKEIRELKRSLDALAVVTESEPIQKPSILPIDEDQSLYICFKCEKSFNHLTQLQNHVEECLQLQ